MKRHRQDDSGTILVAFTLFILVLLGFAALGIEGGRWFMVRAELSKSVDAAALAAARNISNPFVAADVLALDYAAENFPAGYLGTPASGAGSVRFNAQIIGNDKVQVDGAVSATAILARVVNSGYGLIPTSSRGVAQKKEVEIMLVLDRSGSMDGSPMTALKLAARTFVNLFQATQDKDRMGLISFATSRSLNRAMGTNYVAPMTAAINGMNAVGGTNPEDALDLADAAGGFTDQTGTPADRRLQQFLIFFSDGRPTAFRGNFRYRNDSYDAVAVVSGNCESGEHDVMPTLYSSTSGSEITQTSMPTGDGTNTRIRCTHGGSLVYTTRWYIFDTDPVPHDHGHYYSATANCIPESRLHDQTCALATNMALAHAATLKANHVKIYTIGLGSRVNATFMRSLASNPTMYYYAPNETALRALFQQVASEIKLRLVQ